MKVNKTKRFFIIMTLVVISAGQLPPRAYARIRVVATTLELADFTRNIGRDKVSVEALYTGKYDLHFFEPRPVHVMKLKRADMLVFLGMDADLWVQALIDAARNNQVRFGGAGYVNASLGVRAIQVPVGTIDRSMGDVHPFGNPHYWHDPDNVSVALENICRGLARLSPENADFFRENKDAYLEKVRAEFERLKTLMKPYQGTKVVTYHRSWDYFAAYFGLEIIGNLEPKPGLIPSPAHIARLSEQMNKEGARLILVEPYYSKNYVRLVADKTGAKALWLPNLLGGRPGVNTYLENLNYNVRTIVEALNGATAD